MTADVWWPPVARFYAGIDPKEWQAMIDPAIDREAVWSARRPTGRAARLAAGPVLDRLLARCAAGSDG